MNITIVIHSMRGGGAERVTAFLANSWVSKGHRVTLVSFEKVEFDEYSLDSRIDRVSIEMVSESNSKLEALLSNFRRIVALRKLLKAKNPDIAIGMMTGASVTSLLASIGLNIPIIVSERIYPPLMPLGFAWDMLRKLTYPWAKTVVMLTTEGKAWLIDTIPTARAAIIANPAVYPLLSAPPYLKVNDYISKDKCVILAAGRMDLFNQKQFDHLIDAFSRVKELNDWILVILGDGDGKKQLEKQIYNLGIKDNVLMPGRAGNIGDWYERADIFVLSSKVEGFPNVLVEAMSYKCAVVSYACKTGPRDIINHGQNGLLVEPEDGIKKLGDALCMLIKDDIKRNSMATKAAEITEELSPEKILSKWEDIF